MCFKISIGSKITKTCNNNKETKLKQLTIFICPTYSRSSLVCMDCVLIVDSIFFGFCWFHLIGFGIFVTKNFSAIFRKQLALKSPDEGERKEERLKKFRKQELVRPPRKEGGGGGERYSASYVGYIGMCGPKEYGF